MPKKSILTRDNFKYRLKQLHMSQIEFAEKVGYSTVAIKKWKDGEFPGWVDYVLKYLELAAEAKETIK